MSDSPNPGQRPANDPASLSAGAELPVQLTSFVGREREIATVRQMLGTTRLLTLTGAGGSGKTRLALEVAAQAAGEYPHGLAWVELAPLLAPELIPQQLATILGIRDEGTRPLQDTLLDALRERSLLLILDNCEHLVEGCARLAETLLRAAPGLRILATSREALGTAGERAWLVPALSLPGTHDTRIPAVAASEAVHLFVERARDVHPSFALTEANATAVAEICRRLDGIPLALELAAARVKVLTPEQIADRLDDVFRLLTGGRRTVVARQQTLRAAMDWSYALLSEHERTLLQRLSVFTGGFTIEAAEAVCADERVEVWELLDLLSALVDKSLVTMEVRGGEARYGLLETVRQYARERLAEAGELDHRQRSQATFFLTLAEAQVTNLAAVPPPAWLRKIAEEQDNLRAALRWTLDRGETEIATRMAAGLRMFWRFHGNWDEGQRWLREVLDADGPCPAEPRARAVYGAANLAASRQEWSAAEPLFEEALALYRQLGDRLWIARILSRLGSAATLRGDLERAERLQEESLSLVRELGDLGWSCNVLCNLGTLAELRGDDARAALLYEESIGAAREAANLGSLAVSLGNRGRIAHRQGDIPRAAALFHESLTRAYEIGDTYSIALELGDLAGVAGAGGDARRAARLFAAGEARFASLGAHHAEMDRPQYDRNLVSARAQLDPHAWERAWQEGWTMPTEQAVEYALAGEGTQPTVEAAPLPAEVLPPLAAPAPGPPPAVPAPPAPALAQLESNGAPAALRVCALGPLEIYRQGVPLSAEARSYARPRELLLYLLCHPEGRTREQIGLIFWPEASTAQVKNNFHVTLHHLRKMLGRSEWIVFEDERYTTNRTLGYQFDATLFEEQVRAALREVREGGGSADRLRAALALYRGDFLEEETAGDWHLEMRDHLRRLYIEGLFALGDLLMQDEEYARGAEVYQRIVSREDLQEEAHRRLIVCLARTGERARALRHYERLVVLLRTELDTEPEEETTELYERLRQAELV